LGTVTDEAVAIELGRELLGICVDALTFCTRLFTASMTLLQGQASD
jgi:hypothetical protein